MLQNTKGWNEILIRHTFLFHEAEEILGTFVKICNILSQNWLQVCSIVQINLNFWYKHIC